METISARLLAVISEILPLSDTSSFAYCLTSDPAILKI
jgi:hypothetical protein